MRRNWLAFIYMLKGMVLLYNGQEFSCAHRPSLFEREAIQPRRDGDIGALLSRLYLIRRTALPVGGSSSLRHAGNGVIVLERYDGCACLAGVFNTRGVPCAVRCGLPDGRYQNLIDDRAVRVEGGLMASDGEPVIFAVD